MTGAHTSPYESTGLLHSLARALRAVSSQLHPDELAEAIVEAFADTLQVRIAAIVMARPPRFVLLGMHGHTEDEVRHFASFPMDSDYPSARAFREGDVLIEPFELVARQYAETSRAHEGYGSMVDRLGTGMTVSACLSSAGVPVGGLVLHSQGRREWTAFDAAAIRALASALGMWLTHPDSGALAVMTGPATSLTRRQLLILNLIAEDLSNTAIATRLRYSESTIKQEVGRILHAMGVETRHEAVQRARKDGLVEGDAP